MPDMPHRDIPRRAAIWRRTMRLTMALLAIWFGVTFAAIFFARELAGLTLFGWSVSFYLAAQGALLVYLAIVGIYALAMRSLDARGRNDGHGG
jgi:putative solute:sodium symporter small subunit